MLQGDYLGMKLTIEDVDKENRAFFNYCAQGDFRLHQGRNLTIGRVREFRTRPNTTGHRLESVHHVSPIPQSSGPAPP